MPEENDPPQSAPPNPRPAPSWNVLAPEESSIGGAHGEPGSGEARRDWTPPTLEEAPALFSGYEVLGLLGRGGMGAVYQARQIALSRLVAIKLLPLEISVDKDFADRFRREAHAMARLNHPNIIAVHDFGATSAGHLYFVMEYVDGANLAELIRLGALDAGQALLIVEQVCTALAYAHGKGIVHRDIKPANVMIDTESRVKVADFGLARLTETSATHLGHTPTSVVMGTPDYMAPEQMHGMNVDQRADIYSLGVVLYEMLCREVPRGSFDLPSHRTGCDARIDQIVIRATQQSPDRRYQSTQEMQADLTAVRTALPEDSPAPATAAPAKSKTRLYAAIAMGVILLAAVAFFLFKPKPETPATARTEVRAASAGGMRIATPQAYAEEGGKKLDGSTPINRPPLLVPSATSDGTAPSREAPPANATKEQPLVNTLGMKFVPVPILGGPTGGQRVLFSIWDTRVQDYEAFVKETKREWPPGHVQDATHPAVMVNWEDAQAFCQWLTAREHTEGRLPTGWTYRLPSDHEWSCAVGLGGEDAAKLPSEKHMKIAAFPWDSQWPPSGKAGNYASEELKPALATGKYPWIKSVLPSYHDGYAFTSPVGSYAANRFGLFDMGGNVDQWCEDWFDADRKVRVQRGSSWENSERLYLLSSFRSHSVPTVRAGAFGFRCVIAPIHFAQPAAAVPLQIASSATSTATAATKNALAANAATPAGATTPPSGATPAPTTPRPAPQPSAPATSVPSTPPSSPAPKPATEVEKWFAQVDGPQEEAFQKQVLKPYEAGVADLRARYLASADAAIARASATGQLAEALAWRTEREAFGKAQDVAADDAGTPVAVKTLRAAYREQLARLQQDRLAKAKALLAPYDAALAKNQTLLTHRQRLDDALLLKNKREAIALVWLGPSPPATAGAPGRPETATGAAGIQDAAKPVATRQATREKPFVNSLGMRFVPVPIIGGPTNGKRVLFSIWDTRVQDYEPFAKETKRIWPPPEFEQGPTHPAVNESWEDAQAFCAWLTETERASGGIGAQDEYRLPSDHEWSCAVGIGAREKAEASPESKHAHVSGYPWGPRWPPPKGAGNYAGEELRPALAAGKYDDIKEVIAGHRDDFVETAPVGSFPANPLGLFDMGGNVWQWCGSWFDADKKLHVLRGASWKDSAGAVLLSSWRNHIGSNYRGHEIFGFRCVLAPSDGE